MPSLLSALLWASWDGPNQEGSRTTERWTYPRFLTLLVSLEEMEALGPFVIVLFKAIH